jgi:aminoglycoside phosphotransferase (APT) family kinase protein
MMVQLDLSIPVLSQRLGRFLGERLGEEVRLDGWRRYPAGFSWITIGVRATPVADPASGQDLIVRIGDPHGLLAPYRAEPEFRVLSVLRDVPGVPVPPVVDYCDEPNVLGAPFLITRRVPGDAPMPWKGDVERRCAARNARLASDFIDALVALHAVDWSRTELATLWGVVAPADVARAQVLAWWRHAGFDADPDRAPPQMAYARRWLWRHAPPAPQTVIVHGDYRVGNFLQRNGRITAILDWELVHPGDPHEYFPGGGWRVFGGGRGGVGGIVERDVFFARYAERAGWTPQPWVLRYYEILGMFKSASMLLGAARRITTGRATDVRMASMGFQVASTLLELNRLIGEAA